MLKTLVQIRQQLVSGQFDLSRHAFVRAVECDISEVEIRFASAQARVIGVYQEHGFLAFVLLLGLTSAGRPLHIEEIAFVDSEMTRIVNLYEPDPGEWAEFQTRR